MGFIIKKLKLKPESTSVVLSECEKYLFMLAVGYSTFSKYSTVATMRENASILIFSLIAISVAVVIAIPLSTVLEKMM